MDENYAEDSQDLDDDYKRIMLLIKPYILCATNVEELSLYRKWLEKLGDVDTIGRFERNIYLNELYQQIANNNLKAPFTMDPPEGKLPSLTVFDYAPKDTETTEEKIQLKGMYMPEEQLYLRQDVSWSDSSTDVSFDGENDRENASESVYDFTKLFAIYERRITHLIQVIKELQQQNSGLNRQIVKLREKGSRDESLQSIEENVKLLQNRLKELSEVKTVIDKSNLPLKSTIDILHKKLCFTKKRNGHLKELVENLQGKLGKFTEEKEKDINDLKNNLIELHASEIASLRKIHRKELEDLEIKFNSNISELKNYYGKTLKEYQVAIDEKNQEIEKLEKVIDEQCKKMQEEVKEIKNKMHDGAETEKIDYLQKCILDMDKLYKKSEKNYTKQICKLKKEIQLKDKWIQFQVDNSQKTENFENPQSEKENDLNNILSQLETVCKTMLDDRKLYFEGQEVSNQPPPYKKELDINIPRI